MIAKFIAFIFVVHIVALFFNGNASGAGFLLNGILAIILGLLVFSGITAIIEIFSKDREAGFGEIVARIFLGIISLLFLLH